MKASAGFPGAPLPAPLRERDPSGSLVGISSLGGIVTNHAIVLFEYAKREMEAGEPMDRALIPAGTAGLRPVLLTAGVLT
ncbi:MAG: AcrB/AcrD/AcrF family protein [Candidatus Eremiobacteraeota bacterium]|nr:AcrB/AcrD/AcrF family protein [Candidatus Eremiobacteraeota bacterium]